MNVSQIHGKVMLLVILALTLGGILRGNDTSPLTSRTPVDSLLAALLNPWQLDPVLAASSCGSTGTGVYSPPNVSKPDYLIGEIFSPFACSVKRIVNDPSAKLLSQSWGTYARHQYSRVQPWNSDQSLLLLKAGSPTSRHYLLDGTTYAVRSKQCSNKWYGGIQGRWHPAKDHPRERIYVNQDILGWYHVDSCTTTRTWRLPWAPDGIGSSEGNPSNDGRYIMLGDASGKRASNGKIFSKKAFVVDMASYPTLRKGKERNIYQDCLDAGSDDCETDWLSIAATGRYAVVQFSKSARVYNVNSSTLDLTPRPMPTALPSGCNGGTASQGYILKTVHPDLGLDLDGNDILVGSTRCKLQGKSFAGKIFSWVTMVRLKDGLMTPLTDPSNEAQSWHISLRNHDRPGWAYVSYYHQGGLRFNGEVIAVKLDGSKKVERFAHHRSHVDDEYSAEPHAVPSRDGFRILFTSNWSDYCVSGCGSFGTFQDFVVGSR